MNPEDAGIEGPMIQSFLDGQTGIWAYKIASLQSRIDRRIALESVPKGIRDRVREKVIEIFEGRTCSRYTK